MLSQYYAPVLLVCLAGTSLAKTTKYTTRTTKSSTTKSSTTSSPTPTPSCAGEYNQCGGIGFTGPLCCSAGLLCVEYDDSPYFSTCETVSQSTVSVISTTTLITVTGTSKLSSSTSKLSKSTSLPPSTITTTPSTVSSSVTSTTSATCAAEGASCSVLPCCDETLGCFTEPNLSNIPTFTCVIPCAYEYGACGGPAFEQPACCQPGLTCVNDGSPYFYSCMLI